MKKFSIFLSGLFLLLLVSCGAMPKSIQLSDVQKTAYVDGVLLEWPSDSSANQYKIVYENLSSFVSESKVFVPMKPSLFGTLGNIEITPYSDSGSGDSLSVSVLSESVDYDAIKPEIVEKTPTTVKLKYEPLNVYAAAYRFKIISSYDENFGYGDYGETTVISKNHTPYIEYTLNKTEVEFSYKDLQGSSATASVSGTTFGFTTGPLPPVKNVKVENITNTGFKVTFSKYESSDIEDVGSSTYKIAYQLYVNDSEGKKVYNSDLLEHDKNNTPEFIVTDLEGNKEYKVLVLPVWDKNFYDKSPATESYISVKTKVPLKMPSFTASNILETGSPTLANPYTSVEVTFDKSEDDKDGKFLYDVGYYVIKRNGVTKFYGADENTNIPNAKTYSATNGKITISKMNAGNTYKFILYVYNPDDNYNENSTDTIQKKLKTFNDIGSWDYEMKSFNLSSICSSDSHFKIDYEEITGSPTTAKLCLNSTVMNSEEFARFYIMGSDYKLSDTAEGKKVNLATIKTIDLIKPATSYKEPIISICKEAGFECSIKSPKDTYLLNSNYIFESDIFNDAIYICVWPKFLLAGESIGYSIYCK